jgi:hypothetical protein
MKDQVRREQWLVEQAAKVIGVQLDTLTPEHREAVGAQLLEMAVEFMGGPAVPMLTAQADIPSEDVKAGVDRVAADHEIVRRHPRAFGLIPTRTYPAVCMPSRAPRRTATQRRPGARASRSSAQSGDSGDDPGSEPPAVEPWRWAYPGSWRAFVASVQSRDAEREIQRERQAGVRS